MVDGYGEPIFTATLVRRFPQEDVRRRQFDVEDAFSSFINAKTTANPLPPNASPAMPRFVMGDQRRTLAVSESQAQLNLNFGTTLPRGGLVAALRNGIDAFSAFDKIFSHQTRYYCGLIVDIEFPSEQIRSGAGYLVGTLEKEFGESDLDSVNIVVSFRKDWRYWTLEAANIKLIETTFDTGSQTIIHIDPDFTDVMKSAVKIKLDLNTKPEIAAPKAGRLRALADDLPEMSRETAGRLLSGGFWNSIQEAAKL